MLAPADDRASSPLDDEAFAACMARFEPFEDAPFLAVAVSGGADSLALTLLADRWARRRGGRIVGLTVDHGLRPESQEEAEQTGLWLRARKIEHHRLPWTEAKPATGLQHRARDARYALLTGWCRRHGCLHLMTAHHRQDQAETVALREARQSGDAGLAGMAAIRDIPGLRLLRPILGIDKAALEATLRAEHQPWLDDPSNASPAFTRNRLRRSGLDIDDLAAKAEHYGRRRQAAERRAAAALVRHTVIHPAGFAVLDRAGFAQLPVDLAVDVLTRLLMTIGGRVYPPRGKSLSRLYQVMKAEATTPATLAYCLILKRRQKWLICAERAGSEPLPLVPGRWQRWDDRFLVKLDRTDIDLALRALGQQTKVVEKALGRDALRDGIPSAVRPTLPSIWKGEHPIAVPHLGLYDRSFSPEQVNLRFSPLSPLANAPFMPHISG